MLSGRFLIRSGDVSTRYRSVDMTAHVSTGATGQLPGATQSAVVYG